MVTMVRSNILIDYHENLSKLIIIIIFCSQICCRDHKLLNKTIPEPNKIGKFHQDCVKQYTFQSGCKNYLYVTIYLVNSYKTSRILWECYVHRLTGCPDVSTSNSNAVIIVKMTLKYRLINRNKFSPLTLHEIMINRYNR